MALHWTQVDCVLNYFWLTSGATPDLHILYLIWMLFTLLCINFDGSDFAVKTMSCNGFFSSESEFFL